MTTLGFIDTEIRESVATITFSHPASNSFPSTLLQNLTDEFTAIDKNNAISLIILKSEGTSAFCARHSSARTEPDCRHANRCSSRSAPG